MRTVVLVSIFISWAAVLGAQGPAIDEARRISQNEFKKLVAAGSVVVVDTRNAEAYRRGHIPGARLLPLEGLPEFPPEYADLIQQLKASKTPVVTYCA